MFLDLTPGEFWNIPAEAGSTLRFDQHQVSSIQHRPGKMLCLTSVAHEAL